MRLVARMPNQQQVGALVDSLRNIGLDRGDMIISNLADEQEWTSPEEAAQEISFIKTERDGLWEIGNFADGVKGLKGKEGILVAVNATRHNADKIRTIMIQSGALEVVQD
ncbi:MAG: hypothetical protein GX066_08940 [Clostridiaceae bacterium]|nr:hypothetical protein [Clostridiaceae bacterium]